MTLYKCTGLVGRRWREGESPGTKVIISIKVPRYPGTQVSRYPGTKVPRYQGDILYQGGKLGGHLSHLSISPGQANTWPGEQVMQVKSHNTMLWPPQVTRKSGEQVFCVLTVKKIICRLDRTIRSSSRGCWSEVLPNMYWFLIFDYMWLSDPGTKPHICNF